MVHPRKVGIHQDCVDQKPLRLDIENKIFISQVKEMLINHNDNLLLIDYSTSFTSYITLCLALKYSYTLLQLS